MIERRTRPLIIAGPCVIESRAFALETAATLVEIAARAGVDLIYKSSFDKANRTSHAGQRGVGIAEGLDILAQVRATGVRVLTDIHEPWQAEAAAQAVDMLQTPAFLCRQTSLIEAAAKTGLPVNFKKGQFLSPHEMQHVIGKARSAAEEAGFSAPEFYACERGSSFGYNNLVVDMRGLAIMAEQCRCPIIFDATHSVQLPGKNDGSSGGERRFAALLARAAWATGAVSGLFAETHPDPDKAPCDGPNMLTFSQFEALLSEIMAIEHALPRL